MTLNLGVNDVGQNEDNVQLESVYVNAAWSVYALCFFHTMTFKGSLYTVLR